MGIHSLSSKWMVSGFVWYAYLNLKLSLFLCHALMPHTKRDHHFLISLWEHDIPQLGLTPKEILCSLNPKSQFWFFKFIHNKSNNVECSFCIRHYVNHMAHIHSIFSSTLWVEHCDQLHCIDEEMKAGFVRPRDWQLEGANPKPNLSLLPKLVLNCSASSVILEFECIRRS